MIGACTIGKRRLLEVLERYGAERFDTHMDFVIDASERQVRAELERWPDGVYHGESWMVSDGIDPTKRYRIAVAVTIDGSEVTFDFSESDDQAPGSRTCPRRPRSARSRIAFLMLLNAGGVDVPTNSGLFAPIRTVFREGIGASTRASRRRASSATRCATRSSRRSCWRSRARCPTA